MSTEQKKKTQKKLIKKLLCSYFGRATSKLQLQEIADAAGVNRTSINYYFRSRDNLFSRLSSKIIEQNASKPQCNFAFRTSFRDKLSRWLDDELASALKYPFLENLYCKPNHHPINAHIKDEEHVESITKVPGEKEQKIEIEKGSIKPISTIQSMLNITYWYRPLPVMRPLLVESFKLSDSRFSEQIL